MKIVLVYQDQTAAGKPSAWSVITGLLRQSSHSALTAESQVLRFALFVRLWLRRTFEIFSVFLSH